MNAEEMLRRLLEYFYGEHSLEWGYQEGTTVGELDQELEKALLEFRASDQPDAAHKDWCPVNGTEEANTLGACTCGASGNEPNSGTNLPKSSEVE